MYAILVVALLLGGPPARTKYSGIIWAYGADCPACKDMGKLVNKLIVEGQPIIAVRIATAEDSARYNITRIPVTIAYYNGAVVGKVEHAIDEKQLRLMIKSTRGP